MRDLQTERQRTKKTEPLSAITQEEEHIELITHKQTTGVHAWWGKPCIVGDHRE